ncbi:MAG: hypothetical protein HPY79_06880 [Bacteroidales bacterium]|nr:hypothetical protein [Bacteroidales bacterium]
MIAKIISLLLVSGIKFIFAFPIAIKLHFTCIQTIILTSTGGIAGIIFFSFFWEHVITLYFWLIHKYLHKYPKIRARLREIKYWFVKPKDKRNIPFRRKRRYVFLKQNAGILGIALLTPILLSIPLGTFLAVRFYGRSVKIILILSSTVVFWSTIISCLIYFTTFRY